MIENIFFRLSAIFPCPEIISFTSGIIPGCDGMHPPDTVAFDESGSEMAFVMFAAGLVALILGGEFLVRGASAVARQFGLSPFAIGLTIVGFGTSAPELMVSLQSTLSGQPDLALGNALGSNIANILLILGVTASIAPIALPFTGLRRDLGFMVLAVAAIWLMLLGGKVSHVEGWLLVLGLAAFLTVALKSGQHAPDEEAQARPLPVWLAWAMTAAGLVVLVVGTKLLITGASDIARSLGVSEAVIGLTIVAVGTSLPELATSVVAAMRKQTDIAVGNVIGSNIFNIFGILGITAVIAPIPAAPRFAQIDMPWVAATTLAVVLASLLRGQLSRWMGAGLLASYVVYVALLL